MHECENKQTSSLKHAIVSAQYQFGSKFQLNCVKENQSIL